MKLGFIGVGNLATAILRGVVAAAKIKPEEILIYDIFEEKVNQIGLTKKAASFNDNSLLLLSK